MESVLSNIHQEKSKYFRLPNRFLDKLPDQYKSNLITIQVSTLKYVLEERYLTVYHLDTYRIADPHKYLLGHLLVDLTDEDLTHLALLDIVVQEESDERQLKVIERVIKDKRYAPEEDGPP